MQILLFDVNVLVGFIGVVSFLVIIALTVPYDFEDS